MYPKFQKRWTRLGLASTIMPGLSMPGKPSNMYNWKADFIFVREPSEDIVGGYRYYSRVEMNTGREASILDLEDRFDDEVVEYFRIVEYSKPNRPTIKGPANWIPFGKKI